MTSASANRRIAHTKQGVPKNRTRAVAVGVSIALAVVAPLALTSCLHDDDPPDPDGPVAAACTLTTALVAGIAERLTHGEAPESIIQYVGKNSRDAADACQAAIKTFAQFRNQQVEFDLETPDGGLLASTASGRELAEPAPPPPSDDDFEGALRAIRCLANYDESKWLADLCIDGVIDPP